MDRGIEHRLIELVELIFEQNRRTHVLLREVLRHMSAEQDQIDALSSTLAGFSTDMTAAVAAVDAEVESLKGQVAAGQPVDLTGLTDAVAGIKTVHDQLQTDVANIPAAPSAPSGDVAPTVPTPAVPTTGPQVDTGAAGAASNPVTAPVIADASAPGDPTDPATAVTDPTNSESPVNPVPDDPTQGAPVVQDPNPVDPAATDPAELPTTGPTDVPTDAAPTDTAVAGTPDGPTAP